MILCALAHCIPPLLRILRLLILTPIGFVLGAAVALLMGAAIAARVFLSLWWVWVFLFLVLI